MVPPPAEPVVVPPPTEPVVVPPPAEPVVVPPPAEPVVVPPPTEPVVVPPPVEPLPTPVEAIAAPVILPVSEEPKVETVVEATPISEAAEPVKTDVVVASVVVDTPAPVSETTTAEPAAVETTTSESVPAPTSEVPVKSLSITEKIVHVAETIKIEEVAPVPVPTVVPEESTKSLEEVPVTKVVDEPNKEEVIAAKEEPVTKVEESKPVVTEEVVAKVEPVSLPVEEVKSVTDSVKVPEPVVQDMDSDIHLSALPVDTVPTTIEGLMEALLEARAERDAARILHEELLADNIRLIQQVKELKEVLTLAKQTIRNQNSTSSNINPEANSTSSKTTSPRSSSPTNVPTIDQAPVPVETTIKDPLPKTISTDSTSSPANVMSPQANRSRIKTNYSSSTASVLNKRNSPTLKTAPSVPSPTNIQTSPVIKRVINPLSSTERTELRKTIDNLLNRSRELRAQEIQLQSSLAIGVGSLDSLHLAIELESTRSSTHPDDHPLLQLVETLEQVTSEHALVRKQIAAASDRLRHLAPPRAPSPQKVISPLVAALASLPEAVQTTILETTTKSLNSASSTSGFSTSTISQRNKMRSIRSPSTHSQSGTKSTARVGSNRSPLTNQQAAVIARLTSPRNSSMTNKHKPTDGSSGYGSNLLESLYPKDKKEIPVPTPVNVPVTEPVTEAPSISATDTITLSSEPTTAPVVVAEAPVVTSEVKETPAVTNEVKDTPAVPVEVKDTPVLSTEVNAPEVNSEVKEIPVAPTEAKDTSQETVVTDVPTTTDGTVE